MSVQFLVHRSIALTFSSRTLPSAVVSALVVTDYPLVVLVDAPITQSTQ